MDHIDEVAVDKDGSDSPYFPVLRTFAKSEVRARTLSTLNLLSFLAGRCADEELYWEADAKAALAEAFPSLTAERRREIFEILRGAFGNGVEQWVIDGCAPSRDAVRLARGLAVQEIDGLLAQASPDAAASWIAYRVGRNLGTEPAPAARAAIDAIHEFGFRTSMMGAARIMDSAREGWRRSAPAHVRWAAHD